MHLDKTQLGDVWWGPSSCTCSSDAGQRLLQALQAARVGTAGADLSRHLQTAGLSWAGRVLNTLQLISASQLYQGLHYWDLGT